MELETDLNSEIEQLEYAANFLKASANRGIKYGFDSGDYDFERARVFKLASEDLAAAERLQGRAKMLRSFGRDYDPSAFAEELGDA